jgi:hypothetical protein
MTSASNSNPLKGATAKNAIERGKIEFQDSFNTSATSFASDFSLLSPVGDTANKGFDLYSPAEISPLSTPHLSSPRSSMKQSGRPRRASIQFAGESEVMLPGGTKPVIRRTSISFKDMVKITPVLPVSELTDRPETLWFQDAEYDQMAERDYDIVDQVKQAVNCQEDKNYCTRGLEPLLDYEDVMNRKFNGWDSVLNEQHFQRRGGIYDDDYMAHVYTVSTHKSKFEAMNRATQDAKEIDDYMKSERRLCRRLSI